MSYWCRIVGVARLLKDGTKKHLDHASELQTNKDNSFTLDLYVNMEFYGIYCLRCVLWRAAENTNVLCRNKNALVYEIRVQIIYQLVDEFSDSATFFASGVPLASSGMLESLFSTLRLVPAILESGVRGRDGDILKSGGGVIRVPDCIPAIG